MNVDGLVIIGRGRSSLVYDVGDGTVIRRHHSVTFDARPEADAMRIATDCGVPVPAVHDVAGPDIRMDRVDGPTLLQLMLSHPDRAGEGGAILAELHHSLDATQDAGREPVSRPPGFALGERRPAGWLAERRSEGDAGLVEPSSTQPGARQAKRSGRTSMVEALVHGDLHPDNVIMTTDGPMLIDWTNHRDAPRALDLALTWIVLACFEPNDAAVAAGLNGLRSVLLDAFLASADRRVAAAGLPAAAEIRHRDPATTAEERTRIDRLCRDASN